MTSGRIIPKASPLSSLDCGRGLSIPSLTLPSRDGSPNARHQFIGTVRLRRTHACTASMAFPALEAKEGRRCGHFRVPSDRSFKSMSLHDHILGVDQPLLSCQYSRPTLDYIRVSTSTAGQAPLSH